MEHFHAGTIWPHCLFSSTTLDCTLSLENVVVWSLASSFSSFHFLDWRPMLALVGLKFALCNIGTSHCLINRKRARFLPKSNGNWNLMWEHASSETVGETRIPESTILGRLMCAFFTPSCPLSIYWLGADIKLGWGVSLKLCQIPIESVTLWTDNEQIIWQWTDNLGDQPDPTWPKRTWSDVWCFERNLRSVRNFRYVLFIFLGLPFLPIMITKLSFGGSLYLAQYPMPNNSLGYYQSYYCP